MKVVILAGGFGTRLGELTDLIPKPMVNIGDKPILMHIMQHYANYGHKEFIIALGYKANYVKEFFLHRHILESDFEVCLKTGETRILKECSLDWKVSLIDTGISSMTGGRLKKLKKSARRKVYAYVW